jgi:hypothetical protein
MNKIIADYGELPDEKLVGLNYESLVYQPFYIHINHQSYGVKTFDYSTILLNSIKSGNINPHIGVYLYKITNGNMSFCGPISMFQFMYPTDSVSKEDLYNHAIVEEYSKSSKWFVQSIDETQRQETDSIRKQYGLESIEDFEMKSVFQVRNPEYCFYYIPFLKNIFICESKFDAEGLQKKFKEID